MEVITFTIDYASLYYASFVGAGTLIVLAGIACFKWNASLYLEAIIRILIFNKERG
jgi:hypothetical protein